MSPTLHTLGTPFEHSEVIRKSRFVARAAPVGTAREALTFIQSASDASATHNCWAYKLGQEYRFNDDGEPSGTAGRPILQAIEGQGIDHVAIVVTRWYGGIKLGAGGLVRAYGGTAAECLRLADRVPIVTMARLGMRCDFAELPLIKARLRDLGAEVESEIFDAAGVTVHVRVPSDRAADAKARIVDISRGRVEVSSLD